MSWRSTLKAKAREYVIRYYPLGGVRTPEENLASAEELIRGAKFVRDGVAEDVRVVLPHRLSTHRFLFFSFLCRVPQKIWRLLL
jgi:hypothetical protein